MEPTSKLRLGKSTYNSGNPLSFSTIPNLKRKHYNFNMPTFGPDGKVRAVGGASNKRYEDDNNELKTVKFNVTAGNTQISQLLVKEILLKKMNLKYTLQN